MLYMFMHTENTVSYMYICIQAYMFRLNVMITDYTLCSLSRLDVHFLQHCVICLKEVVSSPCPLQSATFSFKD